jgi:Zn-dependent protease with chaperone function
MSGTRVEPSAEKPLSGAPKLLLSCAAAGTILLFYLFTALSLLALLGLFLLEFGILLVLLRFGLSRVMARTMTVHLAPMPVFFRSLWVRTGPEFRIALRQEDAPGLFAILERLCERAQVRVPQSVALEMSCGAWVRLKGFRRGAGGTILGIGYDLLAGLSEGEIEGVLAHEMMHAKLVQRGFKRWLHGGLNRAVQLVRGLSAQAEDARRARRSAGTTNMFLNWADWLARQGVRMVSGCSRQDEFAADLGATRICGQGFLQSALMKLEAINRNSSRLP